MNFKEIVLPGAQGPLAAKRWNGGELPVLALHGWLDNAGSFDGLAPLLTGCDVVCLDFPGHGLSYHRPAGTPYHFVDWVPEVFAAADALGWDRFSLIGHSMGAGVATLAAGTFPQRVSSLVLIEGLGPFTHPDEESPAQLAKSLLFKPSNKRLYYSTREKAVERLAFRELEPHSAQALAERALREDENGWYFHYAQEVRAPSRQRLSEAQVRAFLEKIACPTLLILGKNGLKAPPSYSGREQAVSNLKTITLQGKHHLHLDTPELPAPTILAHLQGAGSSARDPKTHP